MAFSSFPRIILKTFFKINHHSQNIILLISSSQLEKSLRVEIWTLYNNRKRYILLQVAHVGLASIVAAHLFFLFVSSAAAASMNEWLVVLHNRSATKSCASAHENQLVNRLSAHLMTLAIVYIGERFILSLSLSLCSSKGKRGYPQVKISFPLLCVCVLV